LTPWHPCRVTRGELGLLRMALHTIGSALGRKMLEEERNRLETRLEHARRRETVGTLASGIAQDLAECLDHVHQPPPHPQTVPGASAARTRRGPQAVLLRQLWWKHDRVTQVKHGRSEHVVFPPYHARSRGLEKISHAATYSMDIYTGTYINGIVLPRERSPVQLS